MPGTKPPGIIISHSPLQSQKFIGSPSLLVLPNGNHLASHDLFGLGVNHAQSFIYKSIDRGKTWQLISIINDQFWSNLFYHNGSIYFMGTDKEYGAVVIRRSNDNGATWTAADDNKIGMLLNDGEYHTAPVPLVVYKGRIWRSMEDRYPPTDWGIFFRTLVMSAPVNSDLLRPDSWECTNRISFNQEWPGSAWLEGNLVITPQNYLWNILRNHTVDGDRAAIIKVGITEKVITFDPENGCIDFPGGSVKFTIRYDEISQRYYSLTNYIPEKYKGGNAERTRNTLALISSKDLINWTIVKIILQDPSVSNVGFQYVDFRFDGEDIIFVSRTSYFESNGFGATQHDANYFTFHRIEKF